MYYFPLNFLDECPFLYVDLSTESFVFKKSEEQETELQSWRFWPSTYLGFYPGSAAH